MLFYTKYAIRTQLSQKKKVIMKIKGPGGGGGGVEKGGLFLKNCKRKGEGDPPPGAPF